jgi:hypothetical protein
MKKLTLFFFGSIFIVMPILVFSQTQEIKDLVIIETKDGNEFIGTIVSEDEEKIILKTEVLGEITIKKAVIVKRRVVKSTNLVEGVLWDDNPQSSRYLWTPNGYGLNEGEGYYQNIWVLYNQFSYGFSNYFSMSVGLIPLFLFQAGVTPMWIVPKFSLPIVEDKVNMAAGAFIGALAGESEAGFGIVFGTLTLGDRNKNLNFGFGWGYAGGDWANKPIINVSGVARVSARGYLLTENYYIPVEDYPLVILSGGYRFMTKKVAIDFGLYIPISSEMDGFVGIPIVGLTIPFGGSSN